MKAIIVSSQDMAGMNIKQRLEENFAFKTTYNRFESFPVLNFKDFELYTIPTDQIFADYVNGIKAEMFIFASKHKSEQGNPALTAHAIGNFGEAKFGGQENKIVSTTPSILKNYLNSLKEKNETKNLGFEITMEATHHGPFLSKPAIFIELGSNEQGWGNEKAALAIAETIIEQTQPSKEFTPCIGVGGNHYCSYFNKLQLDSQNAFGHVIAKYGLEHLNAELLSQTIEAHTEKIQEIIVDEKGLGEHKEKVTQLLKETGINVQKARTVEK